MAEVILMQRLRDTMTEGVLAEWHKKVGDPVKKGELLADIETDKATMELESYKDGTLLHIGTDKGGKLQVNDLLAIIGQPGEDVSGMLKDKGQPTSDKGQKASNKTQSSNSKAQNSNKAQPAKASEQATAESKPAAADSSKKIDLTKMEEVVLMPRLSDTMTEGVIASW